VNETSVEETTTTPWTSDLKVADKHFGPGGGAPLLAGYSGEGEHDSGGKANGIPERR